ncbi:transcriptional repressor LexA [Candidatus Roizmanbacteria bacterium]|nr:transcriptional repressor LexA [Candidatus Roizmanbacteria bacterium]
MQNVNTFLTPKQKKVLDFITLYAQKKGYAPSLEEIKKHLHLKAISTVHEHIKALNDKGFLRKENNQARGVLPIQKDADTVEIPLVGTIAAGEPIEALEVAGETVRVTRGLIGDVKDYYALSVRGNSMIDEGIFDGDIVVIRKQQTADNGQTVVAIIDQNQATLKKLYREKDRFRLQPANPTLFPIYTDELEIRGVVVEIIRKLDFPSEKTTEETKYKRRIDFSWDYRGEKTKSYTHGFHTYPAMFIPQVARRLIESYSQKGETVCDIFCGSGTALVESRLLGRNAYGIDLNPLAIFLAKVKTTEIDTSILTKRYFHLLDRIRKIKDSEIERPNFLNIDFWFKDRVIVQLAKIKKAIKETTEENIRNFFMVAFSETVRLSSNTKNGEFKLVRIKEEKLNNYDPNVFEIFAKRADICIGGMRSFYNDVDKNTWAKVIYGDSSKENDIPEDSIDCIVTSPPYGDSRTTVAYGQFSRLSAQWIDIFEDPNKASGVDNELLGGRPTKDLLHELNSDHLKEALKEISHRDEKRAKDVLSFYIGLNNCLRRAFKILKTNRHFCIVIGNRLVKQVRIPTDFIIAELSENIGFQCEDIIVRNIPGKRMPMKNSPTNKVGALEETMIKESILVLRKTK